MESRPLTSLISQCGLWLRLCLPYCPVTPSLSLLYYAPHTVHYTLHTIHTHDILFTIHCILYTLYCILHLVLPPTAYYISCVLPYHSPHSILYIVSYTLYSVHGILYIVYCTLHTLHCILYSINCIYFSSIEGAINLNDSRNCTNQIKIVLERFHRQ